MFGFGVLVALGAFALTVLVAVALVRRARRRRRAEPVLVDHPHEFATANIWGGAEWPQIVVRSHGRLRNVSPPPCRVEMVAVPTPSPWEPPRAS
jgi:hypothetical protein